MGVGRGKGQHKRGKASRHDSHGKYNKVLSSADGRGARTTGTMCIREGAWTAGPEATMGRGATGSPPAPTSFRTEGGVTS